MPHHPDPQFIRYAITGLVIAVVLALRLRGMRRARRLRLETLWIVPAIFALVLSVATYEAPPRTPMGWLWLAVAVAIGAGLGWQRGKLMRITIDPETDALNQQSLPAAVVFILALIAIRQGLRYEASSLGIDILKATGLMIAFAFGLLAATRVEMFLRARRMLGEAQAGRIATSGA